MLALHNGVTTLPASTIHYFTFLSSELRVQMAKSFASVEADLFTLLLSGAVGRARRAAPLPGRQ